MDYEHYVDLEIAADNISEALRILDRIKPSKDTEKFAANEARRKLKEAWLWISNLKGDI